MNGEDVQRERQIISTEAQIDAAEIERSNNDNLFQGIQALLGGQRQTSTLSSSSSSSLDTTLNTFIQGLQAKSQSDANPLFINGDKNPAA